MNPKADFKNQEGQAAVAIAVIIMIMLSVLYGAVTEYRRIRMNYDRAQYKEWALEVAKGGFNDSQTYFRAQFNNGLSHSGPSALTGSAWPDYPDAYFMAQPNAGTYTDNYNLISFTTSFNGSTMTPVAGGMMHSVPFNMTNSAELATPRLWARYVIKRQNTRNWSPGGNTSTVNTDPEAVHDVSDSRSGGTTGGTGSTWGITCRAYIYSWPSANDLTFTSYFEGGNILNAPLAFVPPLNKVPLLIGTAKVYGEITSLVVHLPSFTSPVAVNTESNLSLSGGRAIVDGGAGYASVACNTSTSASVSGGAIFSGSQGTKGNSNYCPISMSTIFPGSSITDLSNLADKVGDVSIFPDPSTKGSSAYETAVSTQTFYVLNSSSVFNSAGTRCMVGVGIVVVNGNLTIQDGNASDFAGIVFVNGNVTMSSGLISGILIATGTVSITGGTTLSTSLSANQALVTKMLTAFTNYRVNKASVLTN